MSVPALPSLLERDGDVKACCAELYASEAARWMLGDELHPGGERITLRLAEMAGVRAGDRVVDVAAGPGVTARLLARRFGAEVVGVELSAVTVEGARCATDDARVRFLQGDAEALPLPDELQQLAARGFMVVAQDFQDEWTLDVGKLRKCCVGEIVPDGRLIPFCAYNSVGYREHVRASLTMPARA